MKITQAVILAGGKGTRLLPYTLTAPKPMLPIHGKPFLEYLIEDLRENGITEIVLLVGYLHEQIERYFGDGRLFNVKISYSYLSANANTGERMINALPLLKEKIILLYGDNTWPLNLPEILDVYIKKKKKVLMSVYNNRDAIRKGNVLVEDNIVSIYDVNHLHNFRGINIGYFIFDTSVLEGLPKENISLDDILLSLIKKNDVSAYITDYPYYSVTSPERLPKVYEYLREKKVVFLDRDGVINKKAAKAEYINRWEDFHFLPQVKEALKLLQKKGYEIYIISNQSGIARGMMTKLQLSEIHTNLQKELKNDGVIIKDIYFCPHGWDEGCWCRKPNPGMLFQAAIEHQINLQKSIFIGDDPRDQQAGMAAGVTTYLVTQKENLFDIVRKYL